MPGGSFTRRRRPGSALMASLGPLAIVYPGDREVRRSATPDNNRFAALFRAFAARGVAAQPAVYNPGQLDDLRRQLLGVRGALVWVNPIEAGQPRDRLDDVLREVAATGVFVSTHPDVILKLGTKDILVETRHLGWGSDTHRVDTVAQLRAELGRRLQGGAARVLKQWRGHSGIGVWRVQGAAAASGGAPGLVRARHAQRGSTELEMSFDAFIDLLAPYFDSGGHMVDQAWQPRITEGMVRCYLVQERVTGLGLQGVNALYPAAPGAPADAAPAPGPRLYHGPDLAPFQGLRATLETEWVPALQRTLRIADAELPLLWDCDFLHGEPGPGGEERHVLCEINVSSVAPFPDSVVEPLVEATVARVRSMGAGRGRGAPPSGKA